MKKSDVVFLLGFVGFINVLFIHATPATLTDALIIAGYLFASIGVWYYTLSRIIPITATKIYAYWKKNLAPDESGDAYVWTVVIIGIFILTLLWLMLSPAVLSVNSSLRVAFNSTLNNSASQTEYLAGRGIYDNLANVWRWLPLIYAGGLIMWGFIWSAVRASGRWQ